MRNRIPGIAAALIAAGALAVLGAGAASASAPARGVSGTVITTADEAGYLAYPNIGETSFKQIQSTMFLRKSAEQIGTEGLCSKAELAQTPVPSYCATTAASYDPGSAGIPLADFKAGFGAMGLEACNAGETVQEGFILNGDGTFDVVYAYGASTVTNTHCADNGLLTSIAGNVHVLAAGVPDGSAYALLIKRGQHAFGFARIEAQNLIDGTTVQSGWIPWVFSFAEVGAGVQADPHLMTTSLDNELLAVRHTNITNLAGATSDFGQSAAWNTDQVIASNSGSTFLSPLGSLRGATFKVWGGQPVV